MAFSFSTLTKTVLTLTLLGTVAACSHGTEERSTQRVRPLRMPNPATLYCVKKGGTLEIHNDDQKGQVNYCHLPDGTVMEEWALFRRDNPPKPAQ